MEVIRQMAKTKTPEQAINEPLHRTLKFEKRSIDEENRTIEASVSSNVPYRRWWGVEILGHEPGDIRMERITSMGSFLFAHGRDRNQGVLPIGPIEEVWLDESQKKLRARLKFDDDEQSEKIWKKVKSGSLKGISIGYRVYAWTEVESGGEYRGHKGPCSVAIDWEPYEISLEPTPADASVGVGRSENQKPNERDEEDMAKPNEEEVRTEETQEETVEEKERQTETSEKNVDEGKIKDDAVRAERERVKEITSMCRNFDIEADEHIEAGRSVEEVRKIVLKKLSEERQAVPTVKVGENRKEDMKRAITDNLTMRAGISLENPHEGAKDFRGYSLMELAREICKRNDINVQGLSKLDVAKRAIFGTSDFPAILADVANKTMMSSYEEVPTTYQLWTKDVEASDFKEMHRVQLSEAPDLDEIKEMGEYKHAKFSDAEEKYSLMTYGKMFSLSRKAIINDDLGALIRIPRLFGAAAARKANSLVYGILTSNPKMSDNVELFHATNHKNSVTSGGAPSIDTLSKARALMRKQKGIAGKATLNIMPKFIIVPAELETTTQQLIASTVDPTKSNATPNPFRNGMEVVVDAILDENSTTEWYLAADYNQVDTIEVAFLNGQKAPMLESRQGWDVDGMEFKVRIDVAAKAIDHRGLFKNPGA